MATQLVRNGTTSWEKLEGLGRAAEIVNQRSRGEIRRWFLEGDPIIKDCPFCHSGNVKILETEPQCIQVVCHECGATGPTSGNNDDAIRYWNERSSKIPDSTIHTKGEKL